MAINPNNISHFDIPQETIEEMLAPGYSDLEMGCRKLPGGLLYTATYMRFPGAKGKMVDWWFGSFLHNTQSYKLWSKDHVSFYWDDKKQPGTVVGATHISEEWLDGELVPMKIKFFDPADIFDTSRFAAANIGCALVAEISSADDKVFATFLHIVRDTYYGCEMRNRFWGVGEPNAETLRHNTEEMGSLAEMLPGLYLRETEAPRH